MEDKGFKKQACIDVLFFLENRITKENFMKSYKQNASKSINYAFTISELMESGLDKRQDRNLFAKEFDLSEEECNRLFTEQGKFEATNKIVNSLFDIAYTRIPDNALGGDGKQASYDRKINLGTAAERALLALSCIKEYSPEMVYLRTEYAFPRRGDDFKVKDTAILESIKQDCISCRLKNKDMTSQHLVNN